MLALTLWRPWPWPIFHAPEDKRKRIENRKWKPWPSVIRQRIAIHAGKHFENEDAGFIFMQLGLRAQPPHWLDEGIIGTAVVAGYFDGPQSIVDTQLPWWIGPFAWKLEEIRTLPEPIPCRGAQGLWIVPPAIECRILADEK